MVLLRCLKNTAFGRRGTVFDASPSLIDTLATFTGLFEEVKEGEELQPLPEDADPEHTGCC
jgi:hypothetical protein